MAVTEQDRVQWDERHAHHGPVAVGDIGPPPLLAPYEDLLPRTGSALELACGRGRVAVWLASRGLDVWGVDVSPVALDLARDLARRAGVSDRCRFDAIDLDGGLPDGPPVDVIVCHLFRDPRLDRAIVERLAPGGGVLAVVVLSEVGAAPGPYRAPSGELPAAFAALEPLVAAEQDGTAWFIGRRPR